MSYRLGQQPWIRRHHDSIVCPFCGNATLQLSAGDLWSNYLRLELYCDHPECDVRTMAVVALRDGTPNWRSEPRNL